MDNFGLIAELRFAKGTFGHIMSKVLHSILPNNDQGEISEYSCQQRLSVFSKFCYLLQPDIVNSHHILV